MWNLLMRRVCTVPLHLRMESLEGHCDYILRNQPLQATFLEGLYCLAISLARSLSSESRRNICHFP